MFAHLTTSWRIIMALSGLVWPLVAYSLQREFSQDFDYEILNGVIVFHLKRLSGPHVLEKHLAFS